MRRILLIGVVSLLLPLLLLAADDKKAPNFSLKSSDGTEVSMEALKGKVVVVNFWATWCSPCRREIPDFMEVYKEYQSKGLEIIGISLDQRGWQDVKPYLQKSPITYPIVIGDPSLARAWGSFQYIPTTFIVDKEGRIVKSHTGLMSKTMLIEAITPLL